jgi:pimeloyl-ACP methyl ester carboxylesterase
MSTRTETADTRGGPVEYVERGAGEPVLVVHGSPGGCDQGALLGRFLSDAGFRVVAPSRPGYLGTPLSADNATPAAQAGLWAALMDSLDVERFGVLCWSGGGPSSYTLTIEHPERVTALVALAAVSKPYEFETGLAYRLLSGRVGKWVVDAMRRFAPKQLVKMTVSEEGDLDKDQVKALRDHIWDHPAKRDFVLGLSSTVVARRVGLENDQQQFPKLALDLARVTTPTLLVHGTADTDVKPEYSEHALAQIPGAEILRVKDGTHLAAYTDPTSDDVHAHIAQRLRRSR